MKAPQAETELIAQFRTRLAGVLERLRDGARGNPKSLAYVGSLASEIMSKAGKSSWPELKAALGSETYNDLLKQFQQQAKVLSEKGNTEAVDAIETVATSVIASQMNDPVVAEGDKLLDAIIGRSVDAYNKSRIN